MYVIKQMIIYFHLLIQVILNPAGSRIISKNVYFYNLVWCSDNKIACVMDGSEHGYCNVAGKLITISDFCVSPR